jgi:hypothetical protein
MCAQYLCCSIETNKFIQILGSRCRLRNHMCAQYLCCSIETGSSDHGFRSIIAHFKTTYANALSILSNLLNCAQLIN